MIEETRLVTLIAVACVATVTALGLQTIDTLHIAEQAMSSWSGFAPPLTGWVADTLPMARNSAGARFIPVQRASDTPPMMEGRLSSPTGGLRHDAAD